MRTLLFLTALLFPLLGISTDKANASGDTFSVQWENDRIAKTDRHYTNGFRLSWVSDEKDSDPEWARDLLNRIYPFAALKSGRVGAAFGQSIFTPEDTEASALVQNDRPYAGWLYGGISVHAETSKNADESSLDMLDSVELDFGVVGPYALGRQVQNGVHELINVAKSDGWGNQLDNEPGLMLIGERRWRTVPVDIAGLDFDVIPHLGGSIGNVMTFAGAGAMIRIGQELDVDFGPPLIRPSLSGLAAIEKKTSFAWYLFAGAQGRAVARDIFLDGNTFSNSHSVDKKTFVGDFQFGAAAIYRGVRLAITQVYRTKEFEQQRQADRFGAISLSVRF